MRNKFKCLAMALIFIMLCSVTSFAETYKNTENWIVNFTANKKMESNFSTEQVSNLFKLAEPGDTITVVTHQKNSYKKDTDWYMSNEVLKTLEDGYTAFNGAYSYKLTYTDPDGEERVIYDSSQVGGEKTAVAGVGMHEATDAMEDYFFMDTLEPGEKATTVLTVHLDGNTQGNSYQNTWARLKLTWAVELSTGADTVKEYNAPNTGDSSMMLLWAVAAFLSAIAILVIVGFKLRKREGGDGNEIS